MFYLTKLGQLRGNLGRDCNRIIRVMVGFINMHGHRDGRCPVRGLTCRLKTVKTPKLGGDFETDRRRGRNT